jgi:hypothetical protein
MGTALSRTMLNTLGFSVLILYRIQNAVGDHEDSPTSNDSVELPVLPGSTRSGIVLTQDQPWPWPCSPPPLPLPWFQRAPRGSIPFRFSDLPTCKVFVRRRFLARFINMPGAELTFLSKLQFNPLRGPIQLRNPEAANLSGADLFRF